MKKIISAAAVIALACMALAGVGSEAEALNIVLNIAYIVAGFVLLIKGADIFVYGASKIAAKFDIPQMVIGLTVVAFGTSLPEAAVSIKGALSGNAGISVGNVVGSNILNILLILGISSCIAVLPIKKNTFRYEIPFMILVTVVMLLFGMSDSSISRVDGILFWILFIVFLAYLVICAKKGQSEDEDIVIDAKDTMLRLVLIVIAGGVGIVLGSNVTVDAASYIAGELGMSNRLIGLTIVAFGTSLPELVTSALAAKQGKTDIAIGNIVGSNIFNILFVVGTASIIKEIGFEKAFIKDTVVAIFAAVLLFLCVIKDRRLKRSGGVIMLLCFAAYMTYIIYGNYA